MNQNMTTQQIMFTPIKASSDLASHNYVGQRGIRKQHVGYFAHEMMEGRFRPGTAIAFCCTPDGRKHLVNGQHTLSAIIVAGFFADLDAVAPCISIDWRRWQW